MAAAGGEELPMNKASVADRGNRRDPLLTPNAPDRNGDRAGDQSADELDGEPRRLQKPLLVEFACRPERGGGNDQAGRNAIKYPTERRDERQSLFAPRQLPRDQCENHSGPHGSDKAEAIAGERIGDAESSNHRGNDHDLLLVARAPRHPEASSLAAANCGGRIPAA